MDRTYTLTVHREERVGALLTARLYRVHDGGAAALVAEIDQSYAAFGIGDVFERLIDQLIDHQDQAGELP